MSRLPLRLVRNFANMSGDASLRIFFQSSNYAVVGASNDPAKFGHKGNSFSTFSSKQSLTMQSSAGIWITPSRSHPSTLPPRRSRSGRQNTTPSRPWHSSPNRPRHPSPSSHHPPSRERSSTRPRISGCRPYSSSQARTTTRCSNLLGQTLRPRWVEMGGGGVKDGVC